MPHARLRRLQIRASAQGERSAQEGGGTKEARSGQGTSSERPDQRQRSRDQGGPGEQIPGARAQGDGEDRVQVERRRQG